MAAGLQTLRERDVALPTGVVSVACAAAGQLRTQPIEHGDAASGSLAGRAIERVETAARQRSA